MFLMKHEEDLNTAKTIFTAIGLLIPPLVMIYRQPDLKNTITVMVLFCFMMYVAGLSYKVIAVVLVSGSALVLAFLLVITQVNFQLPAALDKTIGYQLGRIQDWLSDDADNADGRLQQQNSITAIGSGKLTGKDSTTIKFLPQIREISFPRTIMTLFLQWQERNLVSLDAAESSCSCS